MPASDYVATVFQATVGGTPVQLSAVAAVAAAITAKTLRASFGVKVSLPSDNSGKVYYGFANSVSASNGTLLQNADTINPAEFMGDITKIWLVASASGQTVTGSIF